MKIFAIRNEEAKTETTSFLIYYETAKKFYIEISDGAGEWDVPFFMSSFVKKNIYSLNSYVSMQWVNQRIVPPDRQNICQILKDNKLKYFDEYRLLMLGRGRCAQDDYYLDEISFESLPECIQKRLSKRIDDIIPLPSSYSMIVFFIDGTAKICDMKRNINSNDYLKSYLTRYPERFKDGKVCAGGFGVSWNENMTISYINIYDKGSKVSIAKEDLLSFVSDQVVNTAEAAEILNCSRQNIDDLVKRNKLKPIKTTAKDRLFLKSDILKREWN